MQRYYLLGTEILAAKCAPMAIQLLPHNKIIDGWEHWE